MDNKNVIISIIILFTLVSLQCFSQVKDFSNDKKFSVSLSNGGIGIHLMEV